MRRMAWVVVRFASLERRWLRLEYSPLMSSVYHALYDGARNIDNEGYT
jgi:hypothetical protein